MCSSDLGKGDIDRAITVRVHAVSESARTKIEAAGGTIELIGERTGQNTKKGS